MEIGTAFQTFNRKQFLEVSEENQDLKIIESEAADKDLDCIPKLPTNNSTKYHKPPNNKFKCKHCSEAYSSRSKLNLHCFQKHATQGEVCRVCQDIFENQALLSSHLVVKHSYLKCQICDLGCARPTSLQNHMRVKHPIKCDHCPVTFTSKALFKQHCILNHAEQHGKADLGADLEGNQSVTDNQPMDHIEIKDNSFQCEICAKSYSKKRNLRAHIISQHEGLKCGQCNEAFKSRYSIRVHFIEKHLVQILNCDEDAKPDEDDEGTLVIIMYECELCSIYFDTLQELECHSEEHHPSMEID